MFDSQETSYEEVRAIMYEILTILHHHGIDTVTVGGIMRVLGVPPEVAAQHDDEYLHVTNDVAELLDTDSEFDTDETVPPGTTIH